MARPPQAPAPGAPEWMLTFSDCMTLLLTFFVLLMSFSSFDDVGDFKKLTKVFNERFPLIGAASKEPKSAFLGRPAVQKEPQIDKGSEKPTLARGVKDNLKNETFENFHDRKVFITDSSKIFWGSGTALSPNGRKIMSAMADFIRQAPNSIVICEKPVQKTGKNYAGGAERAWSIIDYMHTKHGISYDRFMVSCAGTINNISSDKKNDRIVEIVLLERSFAIER